MNHFELEIDQCGRIVDTAQVTAMLASLRGSAVRELFVMSHGWNTERSDARSLYAAFFAQFRITLAKYGTPGVDERQCASIGLLWPSVEIEGGAAGRMLLHTATYPVMKQRAGVVGRGGVAQTLDCIQAAFPALRIHLAGHSFGCRVITAAAAQAAQPIVSMTLLQAAFSHNAFSPDFDSTHQPGRFRNVVALHKFTGPMIITHTVNDDAVGLAYPLASRLGRDNASTLGDARDIWGGLGRNGARHTPEATDGYLLAEGATYSFLPRRIANLNADGIIRGHGDIVRPETVWAMIAAAGLGGSG
jgi:hypothetical protein